MQMRTLKSILVCFCLLLLPLGEASATVVESRKIDEISNYNWEQLMLGLDFYAQVLQHEPGALAYVIVYGGRRSRRGEVEGWMKCVRNYLVKARRVEAKRIRVVNGGYRENRTVELWFAKPKHRLPRATPTVKPKDVRFRQGSVRKKSGGSLCDIWAG